MDLIFILQAIIVAIVQGLTEFVPVSSTGHMILVGDVIGFQESDFTKMFNVVIQLGSILAIVVLYWGRLWDYVLAFFRKEKRGVNFVIIMLVGILPAAFFGLLLDDFIDAHLFKTVTVVLGLFVGAVLLIFVEKKYRGRADTEDLESITKTQALKVGLFQCLSLWPGMSRSSSTIMGGWISGLGPKLAAEFSFFLAIPIMFGASFLKLVKFQRDVGFATLSATEITAFAVGFFLAFVVALVVVRAFISYIQRHPMRVFAYYRIAIALLFVLLLLLGVVG